jgi:hypothetical protein
MSSTAQLVPPPLQDFENAQIKYVPTGDLHLTFLITPVQEDVLAQGMIQKGSPPSLQWKTFHSMYLQLKRGAVEVAYTCGITDNFFNRSPPPPL